MKSDPHELLTVQKDSSRNDHFLRKISLLLVFSENEQAGEIMIGPKDDFTNEELMDGLLKGDLQVMNFIRNKTFPALLVLVKQGKGTQQNAETIFHDAMVVVFKKLSKAPLHLECKLTTYFLGVCKMIWKFQHNSNHILLEELPDITIVEDELEELYHESMEFRLYRKHFGRLKEKHKNLFKATLSGRHYSELFAEFGYKSADVFKTEIFRIKKRLIRNIKADPEYNKWNGKKNWSL